jgi:hypothetical protein
MMSACDVKCIFCVGACMGMLCMYRLNNVGERTEPCGTAFRKCILFDDLPFYCM